MQKQDISLTAKHKKQLATLYKIINNLFEHVL